MEFLSFIGIAFVVLMTFLIIGCFLGVVTFEIDMKGKGD